MCSLMIPTQLSLMTQFHHDIISYPNLLPACPVSLEIVKTMRSSSAGAGIAVKCGQ